MVRLSEEPRLATISPSANTPTARTTNPMPSASSAMSKLKRLQPELTSVPTVPSNRPTVTIASDLTMSPWASIAAVTKPISIREKYSVGPNSNASSAIDGPNSAMIKVQAVPAKKEPMAAIPSAGPARPCRAIW